MAKAKQRSTRADDGRAIREARQAVSLSAVGIGREPDRIDTLVNGLMWVSILGEHLSPDQACQLAERIQDLKHHGVLDSDAAFAHLASTATKSGPKDEA